PRWRRAGMVVEAPRADASCSPRVMVAGAGDVPAVEQQGLTDVVPPVAIDDTVGDSAAGAVGRDRYVTDVRIQPHTRQLFECRAHRIHEGPLVSGERVVGESLPHGLPQVRIAPKAPAQRYGGEQLAQGHHAMMPAGRGTEQGRPALHGQSVLALSLT